MIVVASTNGSVGIQEAVRVLREGGTAVAAVEAGIRLVEANPDDHTVGYGGYPNILGEVELDASIMNGRTLETGAVGAVKGYAHPISIARAVMERLPHVMLVGDGAARFATEMGFTQQDLLTEEARHIWAARLKQDMPAETFANLAQEITLADWVRLATDPERAKGTVNFIAQDMHGDIACGVSTSGWAWKYPGRLGDTPIIGAGNYADNRYGAAACTGMGEMAIRAATAHSIVIYMKMGMSLAEACTEAMVDLRALNGRFISVMHLIALDKDGSPAGFSSIRNKTYIYQTADMAEPVEAVRTFVPIAARWG
ncbi:MAG: N(4)-(beta-N-acetylglucosaminyl)-L-asparaginase [Ardenticatenaceae bacterium]|nr:N(4)-(beta-N-acetylglucosaminyl)-L-asparaginase [Anaerolineales bacterium]MCB8922521.1 N(4)-(beta-N-acetylglucosaminyl)-L-asparaginase [Ardenticatenaceae bacterium]